jgi:hypothetical protein
MNRAETQHTRYGRTTSAKDLETWLGNSLATILAGLAVAGGVIGLLMVFGYINKDSTNPFQDGMAWMVGGLIMAICANVFRREHHVVDYDERRGFVGDYPDRQSFRDRTPDYREPVERDREFNERDRTYGETRRR